MVIHCLPLCEKLMVLHIYSMEVWTIHGHMELVCFADLDVLLSSRQVSAVPILELATRRGWRSAGIFTYIGEITMRSVRERVWYCQSVDD